MLSKYQIEENNLEHVENRTINTFGRFYLRALGSRPQTPVRRRLWRGLT